VCHVRGRSGAQGFTIAMAALLLLAGFAHFCAAVPILDLPREIGMDVNRE
jgi:hypothetical protein